MASHYSSSILLIPKKANAENPPCSWVGGCIFELLVNVLAHILRGVIGVLSQKTKKCLWKGGG